MKQKSTHVQQNHLRDFVKNSFSSAGNFTINEVGKGAWVYVSAVHSASKVASSNFADRVYNGIFSEDYSHEANLPKTKAALSYIGTATAIIGTIGLAALTASPVFNVGVAFFGVGVVSDVCSWLSGDAQDYSSEFSSEKTKDDESSLCSEETRDDASSFSVETEELSSSFTGEDGLDQDFLEHCE